MSICCHARAGSSHSYSSYSSSYLQNTAKESTQLKNNAVLAKQILEQIKQTGEQVKVAKNSLNAYQNLVENTKKISDYNWDGICKQILSLADAMEKGEGLSYAMSNLDNDFARNNQSYERWLNNDLDIPGFQTQYRSWSNSSNQTTQKLLDNIDWHIDDFDEDRKKMEKLNQLGQSSKGRMQALQVGNGLAAQQIIQIQKLRQIALMQAQAQEDLQQAQMENFFSKKLKTQVGK